MTSPPSKSQPKTLLEMTPREILARQRVEVRVPVNAPLSPEDQELQDLATAEVVTDADMGALEDRSEEDLSAPSLKDVMERCRAYAFSACLKCRGRGWLRGKPCRCAIRRMAKRVEGELGQR